MILGKLKKINIQYDNVNLILSMSLDSARIYFYQGFLLN